MRKVVLLIVLLHLAVRSTGQCLSFVPANAAIITDASASPITGSSQNYWVCPGVQEKVFTGDDNTIWIESGSWVTINGNDNTVRYKGNAPPLVVNGSGNDVYVEFFAAFSNQGPNNIVSLCGNLLVYLYDNAPPGGCLALGMEHLDPAVVGIHPDPAHDVLFIKSTQVLIKHVRVVDLEGRQVAAYGISSDFIPIHELAVGTYVLHIVTDQGIAVHRFVKM